MNGTTYLMNYNDLFLKVQPKRFVDIGAHEGDFSWQVQKRFPECKIIQIEANPHCEKFLKETGLEYHILGLSSGTEKKTLFFEKINHTGTGASFYKENTIFYDDDKYETIEVETDTLDNKNFFKDQVIDLIKIDTQGSEYDILVGGRKTIRRSKFVLIECSTIEYNLGSKLIDEVVDQMRKYEFRIEEIYNFNKIHRRVIQMDILFKNLYI